MSTQVAAAAAAASAEEGITVGEGRVTSAVQRLRTQIQEQEALVRAMRARREQRQRLHEEVRRALQSASAENKEEMVARIQSVVEAMQGMTGAGWTQLEEEEGEGGPPGLTEEDLDKSSLTLSSARGGEPMDVDVEQKMDLEDLLGLRAEEEKKSRRRRRTKKAHKNARHADPYQQMCQENNAASPPGFEHSEAKERVRRLREEEAAQRAALFQALDQLGPLTGNTSAEQETGDPVWLRSDSEEPEGPAEGEEKHQTTSAHTTPPRSSRSSSSRSSHVPSSRQDEVAATHSLGSSSSSSPRRREEAAQDTTPVQECLKDVESTYSSDFETLGEDDDEDCGAG